MVSYNTEFQKKGGKQINTKSKLFKNKYFPVR